LSLLEEEEEKEKSLLEKERKEKHKHKIIEEVAKQHQKTVLQNNTIFTEEDLEKYEETRQNIEDGVELEEIPIRMSATQKVKFT
jgi:hypothetical protein